MVRIKRRRGIGVKVWIIDALKEVAHETSTKDKKVSHTTIANKIWQGKCEPLNLKRVCSLKKRCTSPMTKKGVSMQEWLWLAIKAYGEERQETASTTAAKMLLGKIPPVPERCMEIGRQKASLREQARARHGGKEPPASSRGEDQRAREEARQAAREVKAAMREQKRLEKEGIKREKERKRREEKAAREAAREQKRLEREAARKQKRLEREARKEKRAQKKSKDPSEQIEEQSDEMQPKKQRRKRVDERGVPLSKGQPAEQTKNKDRKVNPDDDFFGGVFNM